MIPRFLIIALLAVWRLPAQSVETLKPYSVNHWEGSASVVDVSFLLDPPAGKGGFIRIQGGHLVKPDGKRFRIWGVNITAVHFPPKQDAAAWAAALARLGVNCVRLHFVDKVAPEGIIAQGDDTRRFDAEQLDRLDFFFAELKKHGIYSDLNLHVGRRFKPGDGVRESDLIVWGKALSYFDPRLRELHKEYARTLLTHYNPYTRSEYRNEPAIAIIELVNENSIVEAWASGRLRGTRVDKRDGELGWQDIPPTYEKQLTERYNAWLRKKLSAEQLTRLRTMAGVEGEGPISRLRPHEFAAAPQDRFYTEASFYMDLESGYFRDMQAYLKETVGAKSLLIGTSDWMGGVSSYPVLSSTSLLDIVDAHGPWGTKLKVSEADQARYGPWGAMPSPMVNSPLRSNIVKLSRAAFVNKPFTVSEVNFRYPSDYSTEGLPIMASYGSLQDWDGIISYAFAPKLQTFKPFVVDRCDLSHDPVKIPQLAVGALIFQRGDVSAARQTVERTYSREQVYETLRMPASEAPYFTPGFPLSIALQHRMRIRSLEGEGKPTEKVTAEQANPIVSDTGELAWYVSPKQTGMITVETERSQALIGFVQANGKALKNLSANVRNRFCSIVLSSLDAKPLSQTGRMLLTAGARVVNTGATWNKSHTALTNWGGSPTLIEPVTGTITLRNLDAAAVVTVVALDGAGRRMHETVRVQRTEEGWQITVGEPATTWYEVSVKRGVLR